MLRILLFSLLALIFVPKPKPMVTGVSSVAFAGGDSMKVKLTWTQPTDGFGVVDSTLYRIKISKAWKWYGDTLLRAANTWVRRKRTTQLSDSLKLSRGLPGDSVVFNADSIRQCRKGACSVPGSAAFRDIRPINPPAPMTVQVVTDSF